MKKCAIKLGVKEDKILLDNKASTTNENTLIDCEKVDVNVTYLQEKNFYYKRVDKL